MTLALPPTRFTPQDLLSVEDEGLFELVNGKLVEKQMSSLASRTAIIVGARLTRFIESSRSAGLLFSEQTFQCFPRSPEMVRRPDIAYVVPERAADVPDEDHFHFPPNIAIEVISPGNRMNEFEEKLADYRSAGIKLVWEVNPTFRFIRIHRLDGSTTRLSESESITGEEVLTGFSMGVKELLPPVE